MIYNTSYKTKMCLAEFRGFAQLCLCRRVRIRNLVFPALVTAFSPRALLGFGAFKLRRVLVLKVPINGFNSLIRSSGGILRARILRVSKASCRNEISCMLLFGQKSLKGNYAFFCFRFLLLLLLSFCFKDSVNAINVTPKRLPKSTVYSV